MKSLWDEPGQQGHGVPDCLCNKNGSSSNNYEPQASVSPFIEAMPGIVKRLTPANHSKPRPVGQSVSTSGVCRILPRRVDHRRRRRDPSAASEQDPASDAAGL
jgi:hypothetical protein